MAEKKDGGPIPRRCWFCDFGTGQRGMDLCGKRDGTGSVFVVNRKVFPNTAEGYADALLSQRDKP